MSKPKTDEQRARRKLWAAEYYQTHKEQWRENYKRRIKDPVYKAKVNAQGRERAARGIRLNELPTS